MERELRSDEPGTRADPAPGAPKRRKRGGFAATYLTPKESIPPLAVVVLGVLSFVIPLGAWAVLTYGGVIDPFTLPTPGAVISALQYMFSTNNFIADVWASSSRIMIGFAISAVLGVPLGILMGSFRAIQALFEPLISFARYLPASAFIPLLIVWLGFGEGEKVAIIVIGCFFQLCLLVADISAGVQKELLQIAYTLGAKRRQVFTRVLIPASLPGVVDTLRIIVGWAWTYLIVAELVGAETGIGHVILAAQRTGFTDQIIAAILTIGILGLITDAAFRLLHHLLFPYVERPGQTGSRAVVLARLNPFAWGR
ncbi:MAG TPA: ABC transporter permease [Chloroflexota bacterium]|jgi:NitT/TauT family transport system permease protein